MTLDRPVIWQLWRAHGLDHHFYQRRLAFFSGTDSTPIGRDEVIGVLDPFAICPQTLRHDTKVASQLGHSRRSATGAVHPHHATTNTTVINHDRECGEPHTHRSFQLHTGHAKGGIAQEMHDQMVGAPEFCANSGSHRPAHGSHTAHANVGQRLRGHPEGRQIASTTASIVDRDGFIAFDDLHQVVDNAIPVGRRRRIGEHWPPLLEPLGPGALNLRG